MMDTNIVIPRSSKINDEMGGRKAAKKDERAFQQRG